jgi:hypothetical protein
MIAALAGPTPRDEQVHAELRPTRGTAHADRSTVGFDECLDDRESGPRAVGSAYTGGPCSVASAESREDGVEERRVDA